MALNNLQTVVRNARKTWAWHQDQLKRGVPRWFCCEVVRMVAEAPIYFEAYQSKYEKPKVICEISEQERSSYYEDEKLMLDQLAQAVFRVDDFDWDGAMNVWLGDQAENEVVDRWTDQMELAAFRVLMTQEAERHLHGVEAFRYDVLMPCVILCMKMPQELLQEIRSGSIQAAKDLLSIDRYPLKLRGVWDLYINSQFDSDLESRKKSNKLVTGKPRKVDQFTVNVRVAAYLHESAVRFGIRLPQRCLEDLFKAIHSDRGLPGKPALPTHFETSITRVKREFLKVKDPSVFCA